MTTDLHTAATDYKEKIRQSMEGTEFGLMCKLMNGEAITEQDAQAVKQNKQVSYENRERIPEPILIYADLYFELTGQEPSKRTFTDFIDTFWAWKDEKLQPDHIRMAWAQAQSERGGFTVGRPGALTITAIGMKSKAKPALPSLNTERIEQTKSIIEERKAAESTYVPMPDDVREKLRMKLKGKRDERLNSKALPA